MEKLFTLPTWQVFILLIIPAFFPITDPVGITFSIIWGIFLACFVYVLGNNLYQRLPVVHDLKLKRFHFHLFFPIIYTAVIFILSNGRIINQDSLNEKTWLTAIVIPIHVFAMYSIFYTIWFIAKAIATIENNKIVGFDNYAGNFFLLWFFPVGIWWMHPKVRRIFSDTTT